MSVRVQDAQEGHLRGSEGRRLCRHCRQEVPEGRRTFCSDSCVHEWKLRSDTKYLRKHVYERDLGVCAACGTDTRQVKILVEDAWKAVRTSEGAGWEKSEGWKSLLAPHGLRPSEAFRSLWQADHVKPVSEGGGACGMDGLQTLCIPCHKAKSAAMRRKKA